MRAPLAALAVVVAAILPPASAQTWEPKDGDRLVFDVFRDGSNFGSHIVAFRRTGDQLTVDSDIKLKAAFGPVTFFHYLHDVTERWSAGELRSVAARTRKDGKWKTMTLEATDGGLKIAGAGFRGVIPSGAVPSTHWNIAEMGQPAMLSTETGAMLGMIVIDRGIERVKTGKGTIDARRYDVKSEIAASFWYDSSGRWVKCAFEAQGSKIDYVLRELPG
jgi:hypothetical protein